MQQFRVHCSPFRQRVEHTGSKHHKVIIFLLLAHKTTTSWCANEEKKNMTKNLKLHGIAFIISTMTWIWIIFNVHKICYTFYYFWFFFRKLHIHIRKWTSTFLVHSRSEAQKNSFERVARHGVRVMCPHLPIQCGSSTILIPNVYLFNFVQSNFFPLLGLH